MCDPINSYMFTYLGTHHADQNTEHVGYATKLPCAPLCSLPVKSDFRRLYGEEKSHIKYKQKEKYLQQMLIYKTKKLTK